jgi:HAD superfamily hydrolase (TIGR01509 family)
MARIAAVISDLGGVLVEADHMIWCRKLAPAAQCPAEEIFQFMQEEAQPAFNKGRMTPKAFFSLLDGQFRFGVSFEAFCKIYSSIFSIKDDTVSLLRRLRRSHALCLLSNTDPIHWSFEIQVLPFLSLFDHLVLSFESGAAKPEPKVYRQALRACRVEADEAVFIDDVQEYVDGASRLGIRALRFESASQVEADLRRLGVRCE